MAFLVFFFIGIFMLLAVVSIFAIIGEDKKIEVAIPLFLFSLIMIYILAIHSLPAVY